MLVKHPTIVFGVLINLNGTVALFGDIRIAIISVKLPLKMRCSLKSYTSHNLL